MKSYKRMFCNICQRGRRFMLVDAGVYQCPICGMKKYDIENHVETKPINPENVNKTPDIEGVTYWEDDEYEKD